MYSMSSMSSMYSVYSVYSVFIPFTLSDGFGPHMAQEFRYNCAMGPSVHCRYTPWSDRGREGGRGGGEDGGEEERGWERRREDRYNVSTMVIIHFDQRTQYSIC